MKTATEVLKFGIKEIDETILEAKICWMVTDNLTIILAIDKKKRKDIVNIDDKNLVKITKDELKTALENGKMVIIEQDLINQETGKGGGQNHFF